MKNIFTLFSLMWFFSFGQAQPDLDIFSDTDTLWRGGKSISIMYKNKLDSIRYTIEYQEQSDGQQKIRYEGYHRLESYKRYIPHGIWKRYDDKGLLKRVEEYVNDSIGTRTHYAAYKNIPTLESGNGCEIFTSTHGHFNSDSTITHYIDSVRNGQKLGYKRKEGKLYLNSIELYEKNKRTGTELLRTNGKITQMTIENFTLGPVKISYFKNGIIESIGVQKGYSKEGRWRFFHENGALKIKAHYNEGACIGLYQEISDNGKILKIGSFVQELRTDTCFTEN